MRCRKCDGPTTVSFAPSWADPRLVLNTETIRITEWVLSVLPQQNYPVAKADPLRRAIGFACGLSGASTAGVTPYPELSGWQISSGGFPHQCWFTIFEHGPLVNLEWWITWAATTIYVYEVYRLPS